jgi:hypothetical protein
MFCYTNINSSPLEIVDLVDIESKKNKKTNSFSKLHYRGDIGLGSPFLFKVSLLSFIFAILSQISSLVVDEAFTIELLGNLFSLYNKIFLLIFLLGLCHLFYNVCFRGHTIRVHLSFRPHIFLFYP